MNFFFFVISLFSLSFIQLYYLCNEKITIRYSKNLFMCEKILHVILQRLGFCNFSN